MRMDRAPRRARRPASADRRCVPSRKEMDVNSRDRPKGKGRWEGRGGAVCARRARAVNVLCCHRGKSERRKGRRSQQGRQSGGARRIKPDHAATRGAESSTTYHRAAAERPRGPGAPFPRSCRVPRRGGARPDGTRDRPGGGPASGPPLPHGTWTCKEHSVRTGTPRGAATMCAACCAALLRAPRRALYETGELHDSARATGL